MDTTGRIGEKVRKIREKARKKPKCKPYLHDDIIPNILCRLPVKNATQCRLVCKGWRDLTLSQDFMNLHFRHSFPMIMIASCWLDEPKIYQFFIDKWWETARRKLVIHKFLFDPQNFHPHHGPLFSHGGLIVSRKSIVKDVIILNPIYHEIVSIFLSKELGICDIFGVFFHPSLRQYCCLWGIEVAPFTKSGQPRRILYKILHLGSSPFMRTICNPFSHRLMKWESQPIFMDKYLYWMLEGKEIQNYQYSGQNDIMQFDIIREKFTVKPCPVPVETELNSNQTHLLNINGTLSFLVIFPSIITIWRLKDHAEQLWAATNYNYSTENFCDIPKPIVVVDGNLALFSDRRLLVCNLLQGTMKCFRKKKYHTSVYFLPHQMSLASLRNFHPTIYIDEKGEMHVIVNNNRTSGNPDGSGSSGSLTGSSNSNSLVNEGSDSQLEGSGPSSSSGEESMSTDDDEEEDSS